MMRIYSIVPTSCKMLVGEAGAVVSIGYRLSDRLGPYPFRLDSCRVQIWNIERLIQDAELLLVIQWLVFALLVAIVVVVVFLSSTDSIWVVACH